MLGRLFRPVFYAAFFVHNNIFHTPRARVVVRNESGDILLVKNWFDLSKWSLPGGGVHSHERFEDAAKRELYEETGILIETSDLRLVAIIEARQHKVSIFSVTVQKTPISINRHNRYELSDIGWHSPASLPAMQRISARAMALMEETS